MFFYIAGWARGQYEVNPVFWLATQANKMGISCPPRTLSQATKKCVGQTHKVRYFWKILLMKLQKAAEGSQVLQTQLAFIPSSWNKQAILDCYYSKIFCYIINPSLTNLFLHFCGSPPPMVPGHKKGKKELSQYPPILTSCLVNNTCFYRGWPDSMKYSSYQISLLNRKVARKTINISFLSGTYHLVLSKM